MYENVVKYLIEKGWKYMDEIDIQILDLLSKNARMPIKQISAVVNLSSPAVSSRLEKLEDMAKSFKGVDRVYAIQAGREIRIVVKPNKVDDVASHKIARDIRKKIEDELTYPGHIKVTVIRELRASEIAK